MPAPPFDTYLKKIQADYKGGKATRKMSAQTLIQSKRVNNSNATAHHSTI